jgi:lipopolysaccharide transport system permease protein
MTSTSSVPPKTNLTTADIPDVSFQSSQIIQPSKGWDSLGLLDLWEYRELLYFMVWREISGAYRQTALGISWLFLRPVINMLLLTLV